jgi:hypothetical protein
MLENFYFISQMIAVVALVPSIIYLAVQVRQNTAQAKANANYQFLEASGQLNSLIIGDRGTASVIRRGLEDPIDLDEDDRFRLMMHVGQCFQLYCTMYDLHKDKTLPESQWHAVRKDIITVLSTPGGKWVWKQFAEQGLTPEFVSFANALIDSGEDGYSITGLNPEKAKS